MCLGFNWDYMFVKQMACVAPLTNSKLCTWLNLGTHSDIVTIFIYHYNSISSIVYTYA